MPSLADFTSLQNLHTNEDILLQVEGQQWFPKSLRNLTIYRVSTGVRGPRDVREFLKWNGQIVSNLASIVIDRLETFDFDNWTP